MSAAAVSRPVVLDVAPADLPEALRVLHVATPVGAVVAVAVAAPVEVAAAPGEAAAAPAEVAAAEVAWFADAAHGAGFEVVSSRVERASGMRRARLRRLRSLPDTVGPGLRLLMVGLNPSEVAADAGVGFAGPTNRFWPAALASGLVTVARDPARALRDDRVGMTDLVKRATPRSALVTIDEYRAGAERIDRLAARLEPGAVCFVGLEGWRAVRDRKARPGWQPAGCGGRPAYVMPSTSGLNASVRLADLVEHLHTALAGPTTST